jgi:hypothetical protein
LVSSELDMVRMDLDDLAIRSTSSLARPRAVEAGRVSSFRQPQFQSRRERDAPPNKNERGQTPLLQRLPKAGIDFDGIRRYLTVMAPRWQRHEALHGVKQKKGKANDPKFAAHVQHEKQTRAARVRK